MEKIYDIIIWGASGFTGRLAVDYIYNNQNTNVGGSNQTITGFITNKNVDNTFLNLSNATP